MFVVAINAKLAIFMRLELFGAGKAYGKNSHLYAGQVSFENVDV
jgi:hypothetical protein